MISKIWFPIRPLLRTAILLTVTLFFFATPAQAERGLNARSAARVGLQKVWSKAIRMGDSGRISGVTIHVSPTKTYQGSEVIDRFGRRTYFSERDLGTSRSGYDQTMRFTDLKKAELAARGLEPRAEISQIPEVTIYVRSNLGTVTAIDAETGHEKWTTQAGKLGYPSFAATASDDYVAVLSSTTLYLLDAQTGKVLDSHKSKYLPAAMPTIDGNLIYLPTSKGVVDVRSTENLQRREFSFGGSGPIESRVTLGASTASWTTSLGHIYVGEAGQPGIKYRFQTLDAISAAPVYMDQMLFATSLDGFAYAIEEMTGETRWNYSAGGPVREAPLAVDGNVYVTTIDGKMTTLDAATGKAKWMATGIDRFVAVSEARVYCITKGHELTVFDITTGGRLGSVAISGLGLPVVNTNTDRIYLVSDRGVLQCLREQGRRWPIARMPARRQEQPSDSTEEAVEAAVDVVDDTVPSAEEPTAMEENVDELAVEESEFDDDAELTIEDEGDPFGDDIFGDEENPFE